MAAGSSSRAALRCSGPDDCFSRRTDHRATMSPIARGSHVLLAAAPLEREPQVFHRVVEVVADPDRPAVEFGLARSWLVAERGELAALEVLGDQRGNEL